MTGWVLAAVALWLGLAGSLCLLADARRRRWARHVDQALRVTRSPAYRIPGDRAVLAAGTLHVPGPRARAQVRHLEWMWRQPTVDGPDLPEEATK